MGGVYILPEARRKGYARKLVETALHALVRGGGLDVIMRGAQLGLGLGRRPMVAQERSEVQPQWEVLTQGW